MLTSSASVPPEEGVHTVQEGRRDTLAWTFFAVQGVGDMAFERLPEPVDALHSRKNSLRNLAAFHLPRELNFCMTHAKGFQIATLLSLDHGWPTFRGHGCTGHRMLLIHERDFGSGMDAPVTECYRYTNGIMVWAWMHWLLYALGTRTPPPDPTPEMEETTENTRKPCTRLPLHLPTLQWHLLTGIPKKSCRQTPVIPP